MPRTKGSVSTCSVCGKTGHNRRTCPSLPLKERLHVSSKPTKAKTTRSKSCSYCGSFEHSVDNCFVRQTDFGIASNMITTVMRTVLAQARVLGLGLGTSFLTPVNNTRRINEYGILNTIVDIDFETLRRAARSYVFSLSRDPFVYMFNKRLFKCISSDGEIGEHFFSSFFIDSPEARSRIAHPGDSDAVQRAFESWLVDADARKAYVKKDLAAFERQGVDGRKLRGNMKENHRLWRKINALGIGEMLRNSNRRLNNLLNTLPDLDKSRCVVYDVSTFLSDRPNWCYDITDFVSSDRTRWCCVFAK